MPDLLFDPTYPHGTVDGQRGGCHGSQCPAAIPCRDVYRRYQGDYSFRKLIDAGMTVAEISARDEADRTTSRERDKQAERAECRKVAAAEGTPRQRRERKARQVKPPRETLADRLRPDVIRLHGEGVRDHEIAEKLGASRAYIARIRRDLGMTPHVVERAPRPEPERSPRVDRRPDIARLNAEGLRDAEVAAELGIAPVYAGALRRELGLAANQKPRARSARRREYAPRYDRRPDVAAAHGEGLTDRQIGERVGISHSEVGRLRRGLGLVANRPAAWRRDPSELMPHGTNACYARGCRCEPCKLAQREYYREWQRNKRAEGIPAEHHGTPYGYQLGCRGRKACPADTSCTDSMLEQDRARRRTAGIAAAPERVPAEPVREHVRGLIDGGRSVLWIAQEAGVSLSGLKTLMYGRSGDRKGEYPANIEALKAQQLLALRGAGS